MHNYRQIGLTGAERSSELMPREANTLLNDSVKNSQTNCYTSRSDKYSYAG